MTSDSDGGKESAICLKIYSLLINEAATRSISLCGRNSVRV